MSTLKSRAIVLAASTLLQVSLTLAAEEAAPLRTVVVTADAIDTSAQLANEIRQESPNLKTVIEAEQLNQFGDQPLGDALRRLVGVSFDGANRARDIQLRNVDAEYAQVTINGRRVLDGNSSRTVQVDRIPSSLVERIEIIHNPLASQDAQGAVGTVKVGGDVSSKERIIGVCEGVQSLLESQADHSSVVTGIIPSDWAKTYIQKYEKIKLKNPIFGNVELVVGPKNGKMDILKDSDGTQFSTYIPNASFLGVETVIFRISVDEISVKIAYFLKVTRDPADAHGVKNRLCGKTGDFWKISTFPETVSPDSALAALDNLRFAVLSKGALAQTTGTGKSAHIVLKQGAASLASELGLGMGHLW